MSVAATATALKSEVGRDAANILGCRIDRLDMEQTVAICERAVRDRRLMQHVAINAAKLVASRSDEELRAAIEGCELASADGQAVVWASKLLGDALPCRVAGIDLMHRLFRSAELNGFRVYILGARAAVLEQAIARIEQAHPRLSIVGYRHGYFDAAQEPAVVEEIAASDADMLFVAMTTPRKERFIATHRSALNVSFVMGVGGAIDVVSGITRRAPRWVQRLGLEWLYRVRQEPRRLLRRYLMTNTAFIALTVKAFIARRLRLNRGATVA